MSEEVMDAALVKLMQAAVEIRVTEWMKPVRVNRAAGYLEVMARQRWKKAIRKVLTLNKVNAFRSLLEKHTADDAAILPTLPPTDAMLPSKVEGEVEYIRAAVTLSASAPTTSAIARLRRDRPTRLPPIDRENTVSVRRGSTSVRGAAPQSETNSVSVSRRSSQSVRAK